MPGVRHDDQRWDNTHHRSSVSSDKSSTMYHRSSVHSNGYSIDGQQNIGMDDAPTYVMEHLATFSVSKDTGIVYPADGMRRLLQLEKTNGIWSQKMSLRLDRDEVLIMDYESGAIMERFPVALIQEPTAFTSHDPLEIYNNILVFIVGDERQERSASRSEMHIFQCQSISAQELVEDLKMLRVGKIPPGRQIRHIPPPPATPPPEPPTNGINVREQVSVFNASSHQNELAYPARDVTSLNDETSSTSSEKYERDVTILNHCFDDIEKFIARLQHAAAASRELERRRRNRKSKKKDLGDGMLTMRAKPPPETEFVDIFQKFKLSFNLLAKLKAHIHDPNAPELVHFLFTPLALIVDASHDTHYGPNLTAKVVSPLLTREAVNLLINCVTSKETELWHSLGDAWLIPRDQWKGYVPPYHPVFLDGWSPEYPISDERDHAGAPLSVSTLEDKRTRGEEMRSPQHEAEIREHYHREREEREDSHYSSDYFDYDQQDNSDPSRFYGGRNDRYSRDERERSQSPGGSEREYSGGPMPVLPRDVSARSDISADSIERNGGDVSQRTDRAQSRWLEELRARDAKIVKVTYPRTANNDKELTVIRGEYLEVLDDSRKWWKARNIRGQVAHVPHTIVTLYQSGEHHDVFSNPLYAPPRGHDREFAHQETNTRPQAAVNEVSRSPRSLPIPPSAPAELVRKGMQGKKDIGIVTEPDGPTTPVKKNAGINVSFPPPPPPPPPTVPVPPTPSPISPPPPPTPTAPTPQPPRISNPLPPPPERPNNRFMRRVSSADMMHEELKSVLTMFRDKRRNIDIRKTPEVYIDQYSTPEAVQKWLRDKGFSEKICKQLNGMNGNEIFALTRAQLNHYCGKSEGWRLDSQITIQRNVSGYKTARSSELRAILARARKKAEEGLQATPEVDYSPPSSPHHWTPRTSQVTSPPASPPNPSPPPVLSPPPKARVSYKPPPINLPGANSLPPPPPPPPPKDDLDVDEDVVANASSFGELIRQQRKKIQNKS